MIVENDVVLNEFRNLVSNVYIQIFVLILCLDFISGICLQTGKKETIQTFCGKRCNQIFVDFTYCFDCLSLSQNYRF